MVVSDADSLFEIYEPHTDYMYAVILRPENFDAVAEELSKSFEHLMVSKSIRYGQPYSITLSHPDGDDTVFAPLTCTMYQYFVRRVGAGSTNIEVVERTEVRRGWRKFSGDPFR